MEGEVGFNSNLPYVCMLMITYEVSFYHKGEVLRMVVTVLVLITTLLVVVVEPLFNLFLVLTLWLPEGEELVVSAIWDPVLRMY